MFAGLSLHIKVLSFFCFNSALLPVVEKKNLMIIYVIQYQKLVGINWFLKWDLLIDFESEQSFLFLCVAHTYLYAFIICKNKVRNIFASLLFISNTI